MQNEIKNQYVSVCYGLPCYVPDHETCKLILPADGIPCWNKKVRNSGNNLNFHRSFMFVVGQPL